jgi:hypothetical protein
MRQHRSACPIQLVLSLQRDPKDLPIVRDSAALLQALADLLLGALGENFEETETAGESEHELEDHA